MAAEDTDTMVAGPGLATPGLARLTQRVADTVIEAPMMARLYNCVTDNRLAVRQLIQNLYEFEQHVDRVETVQDIFLDKLLARQIAHVAAKQRDPREIVTRGEEFDFVVEALLLDEFPSKVRGRIADLVIFVDVRERTADIAEGDVLTVRITDIQRSCAHAQLCSDGGDGQ